MQTPSSTPGDSGDPAAAAAGGAALGAAPGAGGDAGAAGGDAAAAERARFGALAYRRRLLRLRQILERYQWQARQSHARRMRARRLFWELQAIAEEEWVGRRLMTVAHDEFNHIATAPPRHNN
uniref:Uncharacterized protein n=1 Tax=Ananas comosus var. bracteatus TaxID=296719 RepID=A0A6V7QY45_ANACO